MINKQTNEKIMEVFVDCVKSALVSGQEHLVNCKKFNDYLDSITVDDNRFCPKCGEVDCRQHGYLVCTCDPVVKWENFDSEPE